MIAFDDLINRDAAAKILGVSTRTLMRYAHASLIPYYTMGPRLLRFRKSKVLEALEKLEVKGGRRK